MGDSKYGRLFTEADVKLMLALARDGITGANVEDLAGIDPDCELAALCREMGDALTFPPDEPLFLLRGQDLAAHGGAWGYAYEAQRVGASIEFVTAALGASNDLRDWATEHPDRMKVPD